MWYAYAGVFLVLPVLTEVIYILNAKTLQGYTPLILINTSPVKHSNVSLGLNQEDPNRSRCRKCYNKLGCGKVDDFPAVIATVQACSAYVSSFATLQILNSSVIKSQHAACTMQKVANKNLAHIATREARIGILFTSS